ncbi:MAG: phosphatidylserine decarboxylase family protein [Bacteroidota bacterium]
MRLHREGKLIIPISLILIMAIIYGGYLINPIVAYLLLPAGVIFFGLILNFFRNPLIQVEENPNHILSPCNGKVVVIEEIEDKLYFKGPVMQISVFMSPLDVHVNRNPIGGEVKMLKYLPGKYLMAFNPKSSTDNEQNYVVTANEKVSVAYKQIAGFLARRIRWYVEEGDQVNQGEEYGFIRFGSRIDILVPTDSNVKVALGEKVKAGRSILAEVG